MAIAIVCITGCTKSGIEGKWQMQQLCWGADCTIMADYEMVHIWELNPQLGEQPCKEIAWREWHKGLQFQESTVNDTILWSMSSNSDTLFTTKWTGSNADTLYVSRLEKDTLELTSMLNNKVVNMRFLRI